MNVVVDVSGVPFPTMTVEVVDMDSVLMCLRDLGQIEYCDPEGAAHVKGKMVYAAALRRGITLTLRQGLRIGKKVYSVTLAMPGVLESTGRGRKPAKAKKART